MKDKLELKPCPFCGREVTTAVTAESYIIRFAVYCPACNIHQASCIESYDTFSEAEKALQKATEFWNRRFDDET